ncbi:L-glutamate gamma-semialdehyde dehydrogenase [Actinomadura madurae]|uniref:L-glutamate gamma-semialdehyde dehydrogenase n=1 Tax=Actinomadura madurae TaxID=1993 RepID=UPI0020D21BF8|nr:L-glutamate gamma-semialdehyde dehydrogenase [Actinomadura madurae]MCQ0008738.1 L-glutamate gamma-semialdehyde dehydrogenase [Actinomadura madurae]
MDAVTNVPVPVNEPVKGYAPGSGERAALEAKIKELGGAETELTMTIAGERRMGAGTPVDVVEPHNHGHVLGRMGEATEADVAEAIAAAREAAPAWRAMAFEDRAAILLRAADLLAGPWRSTLNAATILGQSKSVQQAEIDAACELIDFWRFNVRYAQQIHEQQPLSSPGVWNRLEYRPLEGFVLAITPFNFTAIAGNLPTAPALMGNVVVWKPSPTQQLAAHHTMRLLEAAGLPPGVINMVTGNGQAVSAAALRHPDLAGLHFTGSVATFQRLWRTIGENIAGYRGYPRIVGETGGKDFVVAHPSADPAVLKTALVRGAFEYQGQKCSAASRAYIPRSIWDGMRDEFCAEAESLTMGNVAEDLSAFMGAVIDDRAFAKHRAAIERARRTDSIEILTGGELDDSRGYFVRPTVLESSDPTDEIFTTEYFGPIIGVHVYDDRDYDAVLRQMESVSEYALTGAIIAEDRAAIAAATEALRFAAGQLLHQRQADRLDRRPAALRRRPRLRHQRQGRSVFNLTRWTSVRSIKETFVPPTDHRYPHMAP